MTAFRGRTLLRHQIHRQVAGERSPAPSLKAALQSYGYSVTTLPIILGVSGSHYHTTTDALKQIVIEHTQANSLLLKLYEHAEHAVTSLHNIVMSRRVLERGSQH